MKASYRKSFIKSVLLHAFILVFLVLNITTHSPSYVIKKTQIESRPIIQTTAVSEEKITQEVQRIQALKAQEIAKEQARQDALKEEARRVTLKKKAESLRLAKLKAKTLRLKKRRALERKKERERVKQLQSLRAKEMRRLAKEKEEIAKLKAARLEEEKQLQLAKDKQEAERKRLQKEQELALKAEEERRLNGVVDKYKSLILSAIGQNWIVPEGANKNLSSKFEIRLSKTGEVLDLKLLRSSGDPILDRSARMAIYKAQPLPVPNMPEAYALFKVISLTVRPWEAIL